MWFHKEGGAIPEAEQDLMMERLVEEARERIVRNPKRVLLLPPDTTRYHSGAGHLTNKLYHLFGPGVHIDVIPTLGQHLPHTPAENEWMFGDIPNERIHAHDWLTSCIRLGEIERDFVNLATQGIADWGIPIDLNRAVTEGNYDLVINIGQVVPHEVLGFANHNKNYFIGLGGKETICTSHLAAAMCGIENNLGQMVTPLRGIYNVAEKRLLGNVPDLYVQIVKSRDANGELITSGLYVGDDLETYLSAARHSRDRTVTMFDTPPKKVVCLMDAREFKSTWVANKAIYRTRKAIADDGELIVIALGVERFGEQPSVETMIRRHGYKGTPNTMRAYESDPDLHDLAHAAAHLIHGSTEGRFRVRYVPGKLSKEEVESVGYDYMAPDEALKKYNPEKMKEGYNTIDGEEVFYISSPSLGLWTGRDKYVEAMHTNQGFVNAMIKKEPGETLWEDLKKLNETDMARYRG